MKYRRNKVKREHSIIEDALQWLEELSRNPEVSDIIPGVIETAHSPERGMVYKYETQTGCKLLIKSNGSVQEAFVVTKNPAWVRAWVEKHFPTEHKTNTQAIPKLKSKEEPLPSQTAFTPNDEREEPWIRQILTIRRNLKTNKKRKVRHGVFEYDERGFVAIDNNLRNQILEQWAKTDSEEVNLTELVDPTVRSALQKLKDQLEENQKQKKKK